MIKDVAKNFHNIKAKPLIDVKLKFVAGADGGKTLLNRGLTLN